MLYLRLCKERGVEAQESVDALLRKRSVGQEPRLDLSGHSLSVDTCCVLGHALQEDIVVTELSLSDCMLCDEGCKLLLTGLFNNTTVKVLDLKGNNLKSEGAEVLGKLLACNTTLQRLVLEWNALGLWAEAFSLFCEGLASNTALTQLDLRNNQINHDGASQLAQALVRNSSLEALDLRWNNIGLLGGRSLLEALQKNKRVVHLEMAGNNIPSDTLRGLEQSTGHNWDCQATLRESHSRTRILSREIQSLQEEKGRQFVNMMETIDRQKQEMGHSSRTSLVQIGQLQEALNERKSAVNSMAAKLQMTEAALALSEQKNHNMGELLTQVKVEKEEQLERWSREKKKELEDSLLREGKLLRQIQNLTEINVQLSNKVEEMEHRSKSQQQQLFELKQQLTNDTAELKLRLAQAKDRLEMEKQRSKQALEDMNCLRQKEMEHATHTQEESERALNERILKLEGLRIQLEEELSKAKALCVTERAMAEQELQRVRTQIRQEEQEHVSSLGEKLHSLRSSLQELQLHGSQQKQTISELQLKNSQQNIEMESLRRRIDELNQELSCKDQVRVAEVSRVRVELQEQIGHLDAERTAQVALKEKISALEREIKVLSSNYKDALLDRESEMSSMLEKLRLKEAEIQRMREDEAHRASLLQNAILAYVQSSSPAHYSSSTK